MEELEVQSQKLPMEEIVELRFEATSMLTSLPRSEWNNAYQILLGKHPTLTRSRYREIFDVVFSRIKNAYDVIDTAWNYYQPDKYAKDVITQRMDVASPESSRRIFEVLFGEKATGDVQVERGVTSLRIIVNDNDFKKFGSTVNENGDIITNATSRVGIDDEIPNSVLGFRRGYGSGQARIIDTVHEAEHAFSVLLQYRYKLLQSGNSNMSSSLVNRLRRGLDEYESRDIHYAREELLASFTSIELVYVPIEKYSHFDNLVQEICRNTIQVLMEPDNWQISNLEDYTRLVNNGVNAFLSLYNLHKVDYREQKTLIPPSRMAINILEQFPLRSWAAVARFISSRHKMAENYNNNVPVTNLTNQTYDWKYLYVM